MSPLGLLLAAEPPHMNWLKLGFAIANFVVLLFILRKVLFRPLGNMAAERHDELKAGLEEAAKLRADAQTKLDEYSQRIARIDDEVAEIVAALRKEAEAEKARILAAAAEQARQIKLECERTQAAELGRVEREIKAEAVRAAASAAEKILREKVTTDDERRIVERFAKELEGRA